MFRTLFAAAAISVISLTAHAAGMDHFNRGFKASADKKPDVAIASYTLAIKSNDLDQQTLAKAYNNRGLAFYRENKFHAAVADFDRALAIRPANPVALNNRGLAFRSLDRKQNALSDFKTALKFDPNYTFAMSNHGKLLHEMGRPGEAIAQFDKLLAVDPDYAYAYKNRGKALRALGRMD